MWTLRDPVFNTPRVSDRRRLVRRRCRQIEVLYLLYLTLHSEVLYCTLPVPVTRAKTVVVSSRRTFAPKDKAAHASMQALSLDCRFAHMHKLPYPVPTSAVLSKKYVCVSCSIKCRSGNYVKYFFAPRTD